jgi:hypothetical protein
MFWAFMFNYKLLKKEPFNIKGQKVKNRWLFLERDSRVLKDGAWSKKKTGRKFPRKIHVNNRKLLPEARLHIFSTRKRGFTVDITNSFLFFFKYKYQKKFSSKKLFAFLFRNFNKFISIMAFLGRFRWNFCLVRTRFYRPYVFTNILYRVMLALKGYGFVNLENKKTLNSYNSVDSDSHLIFGYNNYIFMRNKYLYLLRKMFRKLRYFSRRFHRKLFKYKHLYDPVFISFYKKRKSVFFLFTMFKNKKWSICLDNKTSRFLLNESKLKRNAYKLMRFKKAKVIRVLQSNTSGMRRRRYLFKTRKHVFKFLKSHFKYNIKRFLFMSKKNSFDFEFVANSFYNNLSFLVYRLGFISTFTASLSAIKNNWFCLDFCPVDRYTSLVGFSSVVTLYPSLFVFSAYAWYRNFFIRQFYRRSVSNKHFILAKKSFFVFAFRKKYKTSFMFNRFELIKPFVLKNLKMV